MHQLPLAYQASAHLDVLQRQRGRDVATLYAFDRDLAVPGNPIGLLRVSRTLASNLRRVSAEIPSASRYGTREWSRATAIQIRSLVPEFPRATGIVGCSPRCRTEPFPLIWQVSPAYKTGPHAGADYIRSRRRGSSREQGAGTAVADRNRTRLLLEWMWRVDLHHHQQAYETCAPLFVLRHRRYKAP